MNALYYYDSDTDQMKAVLVDPPLGYKDDTDYQLRNLAHKAEGEARKARDAGRNWDADYFAALAARYHKQAAARYRPTVQPHLPPADPLPVRIAIALIVAVFAAFAIGWIIGLVIA